MNSEQGSQFTSPRFTGMLQHTKIRISTDGRGRWMDNVFLQPLWHSLRYACVCLHMFETGLDLCAGLSRWIDYCNAWRPHSTLIGCTAAEAYGTTEMKKLAA